MAKLEIEHCGNEWSGELESLPLSARLKLLLSRKQRSDSECLKETVAFRQRESVTTGCIEEGETVCFRSEGEENIMPGQNPKEVFLDAKMLDSPDFEASDCSLNTLSSPSSSTLCVGSVGDRNYEINCKTSSLSSSEFVCNDRSPGSDFTVSTLQHTAVSYISSEAENEYDNAALALSSKSSLTLSSVSSQGEKVKPDFSGDFDDALENIVLRERRKILLSRLLASSQKPCIQESLKSKALPSNVQVKGEPFLFNGGNVVTENSSGRVVTAERELGVDGAAAEDDSVHLPQNKTVPPTVKLETDCLNTVKLPISESNDSGPSSLIEPRPSDRQETGLNIAKSGSFDAISVKIETFLSNEYDDENKTYQGLDLSSKLQPVKTEETISFEASDDELDHMPLLDRLMLLSKKNSSGSDFKNPRCPSRAFDRNVLKSVESITVTRPRKKKRTATNCPETALEEDVPGLIKVLTAKGVSLEDIKLYGEPESDEVIDESFCENSFTELEAVIGKIFSYREPLLKVAPRCNSKGSNVSNVTYCLGCLLSLIEQAHFLRSRKWPVEWGWARDLQAFIFVFERHNRIVVERPEYGYATYFFDMLDSVSVSWHIRRLVIAMKLAGSGRMSLLENKPLKVGEDITEGEARVLAQYNWVPDTGLATMVNYCGRVVHDTNKERDGNEWRQKIGKMLEDGYNGGRVVPRFRLNKENYSMEKEWLPSSPEFNLEL